MDGVRCFTDFLHELGLSQTIALITREHIEMFLERQLADHRPSTAATRFRSLRLFWRWCVEEGEVKASPMARTHPPAIPETPVPGACRSRDRRLRQQQFHRGPDAVVHRAEVALLGLPGHQAEEPQPFQSPARATACGSGRCRRRAFRAFRSRRSRSASDTCPDQPRAHSDPARQFDMRTRRSRRSSQDRRSSPP
jgi:hypothetical protein